MANTRHIGPVVQLDSGLIIPSTAGTLRFASGAAANYVLTSDASGNATWKSGKDTRFDLYTWVLDGEVTTGERNGPYIRVGTGEVKKLNAVEASILEGTEAECVVKLNGTAVEGLGAIKVTKTAAETKATATPELKAKDHITMEVKAISATPKKLALCLLIESLS